MLKLDLTKYTKIPLKIEDDKIVQDLGTTFEKSQVFGLGNMSPELLNSEITSPDIFFRKYINIDENETFSSLNVSFNLYIIPPNQAGIEYTKTKACESSGNRIYEIVNGGGTAIIQNFSNSDGDVIISTLRKEQKLFVPKGYTVSFSNTKQSILVIVEVRRADAKDSYNLADLRGMSYYIIRKNAKQEIVKNPIYKDIKNYRKVSWDKINNRIGITLKTPVIKQILKNNEKITALLDSNTNIL